MKIYIDGNYYSKEQAKISVFDHGLLYGDGIFEGIRIYNKHVFKLKEHLLRLYKSAKAINLNIPLTIEEMEKTVNEVVRINKKEDGYIRLIITRGRGDLGIDPGKCLAPSVIIIASDIELYPKEYYTNGIKIITSSLRRLPADGLDPRIKSLNYLNNILAKIEAKNSGCLEAVMLNKQGFVTECTGDNIFIIKDQEIITPQLCEGILDGITRQTIFEFGKQLGMLVRQSRLSQYDLYNADECFLTGSGAEIIPVVEIDGRKVGNGKPGNWTKTLIKIFNEKKY